MGSFLFIAALIAIALVCISKPTDEEPQPIALFSGTFCSLGHELAGVSFEEESFNGRRFLNFTIRSGNSIPSFSYQSKSVGESGRKVPMSLPKRINTSETEAVIQFYLSEEILTSRQRANFELTLKAPGYADIHLGHKFLMLSNEHPAPFDERPSFRLRRIRVGASLAVLSSHLLLPLNYETPYRPSGFLRLFIRFRRW